MGMCAIKGPVVLHEEEPEDGELSPRSTMSSASRNSISSNSSSSNSSGYASASSLELDSSVDAQSGPVWQRSIPKGRRCKPLSFSGMILYDENGKQLEFSLDDLEEADDDDEYFSTQRNLAQWEPEFQNPTTIVVE